MHIESQDANNATKCGIKNTRYAEKKNGDP